MSWLLEQTDVEPAHVISDSHWIRLKTTVRDADKLLDAGYAWFQHWDSGKEVLRPLQYSLPQDLRSVISLIILTMRPDELIPHGNRTITPSCIRALYNIPANLKVSKARGLGVYASQRQVAKFAGFALFAQKVEPPSKGVNFSFLKINGGTTGQNRNSLSNDELSCLAWSRKSKARDFECDRSFRNSNSSTI
ncbi:tripeptidyl peptidase SED3 [Colletotrichum graminicola M1.001]|uniref:Tripeptidyl peptidase SED3 n=1 Tax=Colletotrichum graminicola (strain M1.001 / M2 / FGSC 10212) TaxID=645133 RepID=E3QPV4_COLGM|nr:tripeptidyl peptidase SED3 [Colletotrichum graminicola M1.001]EFQ32881.1 tripeptidyl peptidase SED3 [Colletotrichum graminicola M1.001]